MTQTQTLLDGLFRALADGICVAGDKGAILYMNPAAERMLGVKAAAVEGSSLCELLCGHLTGADGRDFAAPCPLRRACDPTQAVTYQGRYGPRVAYDWSEFRVRRQEHWTHLRVRCLRMPTSLIDAGGLEPKFLVIQDATSEFELEQHKEDWRNMVAHDLRSPLTNIYGGLRLLEDFPDGKPLGPEERQVLAIGSRACRRMLELLNLYLDIAKLDAALMPVELKAVSLLDTVSDCVEIEKQLARERGVTISIEVLPDLRALADRELLTRVVENLLNNAVKFSRKGSEVKIAARRDAGGLVLSVADRGPGIDSDEIPLLFDRFHQSRARRTGKIQGTGLGLTFCREAMRLMGGEVGVRSVPGEGSGFWIKLPQAGAEAGR